MKLLVQIRTVLTILLCLFITNCITAQHKIDKDVIFSHKGKNSYADLNSFLGNIKLAETDEENCTTVFGIIRFQITPKGKIASINTEGNLPNALIDAVKTRIYLTENSWLFSKSVLQKNKNIEFYYPIYIELSSKCNFKIHESYILLKQLFENKKVLTVKDGVYYIEPMVWYAAIR